MATVFAQLYVGGVHYGVHAFLVPLRSEDSHKILPGVRIKDCGHKMGLNGIDNGRFWFDHVRIPREYLLNRYGNVTREGEYESPIPDNDMRFAASLGADPAGERPPAATSPNRDAGAARHGGVRRAAQPTWCTGAWASLVAPRTRPRSAWPRRSTMGSRGASLARRASRRRRSSSTRRTSSA